MKKRIVSALLILCFILSALALSSCGKDGETADTTAKATEPAATESAATESETEEATTVEATTDKWQCQYFFHTDMTTNSSTNYDFSCVFNSTKDHNNVTVKICEETDDGLFYFDEVIKLKAYEDYVFYKSNFEGKDINSVKIVFDFGGNQAGTEMTVRDIVLKEHGCDDGAGQPGDTPGGGGDNVMDWDYNSVNNLWKSVDDGSMFDAFGYYFAAGGDWHSINFTEATHSGNTYELTLPADNGENQWQAQFHIDTKLTASAAKQYHFQVEMEVDQDCPQVTIKLTDAGDTNFFCEGRHDISADGPFIYTAKNVTLREGKDADAIRLFFDFGGSPGGTNVKISKIVFMEAQ